MEAFSSSSSSLWMSPSLSRFSLSSFVIIFSFLNFYVLSSRLRASLLSPPCLSVYIHLYICIYNPFTPHLLPTALHIHSARRMWKPVDLWFSMCRYLSVSLSSPLLFLPLGVLRRTSSSPLPGCPVREWMTEEWKKGVSIYLIRNTNLAATAAAKKKHASRQQWFST